MLAKILNDQGSQSANTTIGFFHSSLILFMILLVDLAGWPFRWIRAHLDSSSNPFSTNLSNIPPVSIAITKSISSSTSFSFSLSTLYGTPYPESPTSSLQLILIHSPLRFLSSRAILPIILAPSSSGLNLKSSLRHFVTISRSSARLLLSF